MADKDKIIELIDRQIALIDRQIASIDERLEMIDRHEGMIGGFLYGAAVVFVGGPVCLAIMAALIHYGVI